MSTQADYVVVLSTVPSEETGKAIAGSLVSERLAACVNIVAEISSVYRWQGKLEESREALLVIKTRQEVLERLMKRIVELHPYEVPEVVVLPIVGGHLAYLEWVSASVDSGDGREENR